MLDCSIWMVECAHKYDDGDLCYNGAWKKGEQVETGLSMIAVKGPGFCMLVDTYLDTHDPGNLDKLRDREYFDYIDASEGLARIGIDPADVTHVVITHAHWDHIGAVRKFPNAKFYIQKEELFTWFEILAQPPEISAVLTRPVDYGQLTDLLSLERENRLVLLDGEEEDILPDISVIPTFDGHSPGGQIVVIRTTDGDYIATGDVTLKAENLKLESTGKYMLPCRALSIGDARTIIAHMALVRELCGGQTEYLLITHDPENTYYKHPAVVMPDGLRLAEIRLASAEKSVLHQGEPLKQNG